MSFGLSDLLEELLSRDPQSVKVKDLEELQTNLKDQGYTPPNSPVDGIWKPTDSAAFSRFERDAYDQYLSGNKPGAISLSGALSYLGHITPAGVWQGLVGSAKGIVEQAPETAENLGLVGGAAGGAAIGASIGSVVAPFTMGASVAVGAGLGAAVGFLGDLFGDDESEGDDRSGMATFLDALTPFEEYTGEDGGQRFLDDLNFIGTAASLIRGGGIAISGAAKGIAATQAGLASGKSLYGSLIARQAAGTPGIAAHVLTAAKAPLYGAVAGGAIGGFATGSTQGALAGAAIGAGIGFGGKQLADPIMKGIGSFGLSAQGTRPFLQTLNGAFTGLSAGQLGARATSDLLPGQQKIETALDEQPLPPGHQVLDWLGLAIYPSQLLPIKGLPKQAISVVDRMANAEMLSPTTHAGFDIMMQGVRNADGKMAGFKDRDLLIRTGLSPTRDPEDFAGIAKNTMRFLIDSGRWRAEAERIRDVAPGTIEAALESTAQRVKDNGLIEKEIFAMRDKVRAGETVNPAELENTIEKISYNFNDPLDMRKGEMNLPAFGKTLESEWGRSFPEGLPDQIDAEDIASWANGLKKTDVVRVSATRDEGFGGLEQVIVGGPPLTKTNPEYETVKAAIAELKGEAKKIDILDAADPVAAQAERTKMLEQAKHLEKQLKGTPKIVEQDMRFIVGSKPDPANGIRGTTTYQVTDNIEKQIRSATETLKGLESKATKASPEGVATLAKTSDTLVSQLAGNNGLLADAERHHLIPTEWASEARAELLSPGFHLRPDFVRKLDGIADHLSAMKDLKPREVDAPAWMTKDLPPTKMLLAGGPEYLDNEVYDAFMEVIGMKNLDVFAASPNTWETVAHYGRRVGGSFKLNTDHSIQNLRKASQDAAFNQVVRDVWRETGERLPFSGGQGINKLWRGVRDDVKDSSFWGPLQIGKKTNAAGVEKMTRSMPIVELRQLKPEKIKEYLDLDMVTPTGMDADELALRFKDAIHKGSALHSNAEVANPMDALHALMKNFQVDGLAGGVDWMRMWRVKNPARFGAITGGVLGAGVGYGEDGDLRGALVGGALGAAAGAGGMKYLERKWPKGTYGYLPDWAHRASMAMRYTFSLAFDLGRRMENATVSTMKEGLPFTLDAPRLVGRREWTDIMNGGTVTGMDARKAMMDYHGLMTGGKELEQYDEMLRFAWQRGVTGYAPPEQEAARAWMIAQRDLEKGIDVTSRSYLNKLHIKTRGLEGYGAGRTALEKSVNYVFFPFSFQKKLLSTLGDFVLQEPGRALLIHEGLKRFTEVGGVERAGEWFEKYVPLANQLKRLNNLAYGVSPGRFFLEGIVDHKTPLGTISQGLGSIFVPSGSNTPAAQLFGGLGDSLVHLFTPTVITNQTAPEEAWEAITNFIPAIRDIDRTVRQVREQAVALPVVGQGAAPYYQLQTFADGKRVAKDKYQAFADMMGYSSVDSFFQSEQGRPFYEAYKAEVDGLAAENPSGFEIANKFENDTEINRQALFRLAQDPKRSDAEDAILEFAQQADLVPQIIEQTGVEAAVIKQLFANSIHQRAVKWADDREFRALWNRFMAYQWGPISKTAVA